MSLKALSLDHGYARALPQLSVRWQADPRRDPRLVILNTALAGDLGLDEAVLRSAEGVAALAGTVPEGAETYAQAYAGHQFGGYVPRLGDGRAVLLGELLDPRGRRWDLHLKGAGRTPFARGGDGNAALGPMLREYLISEAMHALGVPTTRSLAVVTTGEQVIRERVLPGAVLARAAASHLRVGTFQFAAAAGDVDVLRGLADYAIARHHPASAQAHNPYLDFYARVVDTQAVLVARWMLIGFVHGVMNTDNMTISGQTIDYGPCAFMESFDPGTVFSSIDRGGRYAYGNQPAAAQWNLARLAEALVPLIDTDTEAAVGHLMPVLEGFADHFNRVWRRGLAAKLGLGGVADAGLDPSLIDDALALLAAGRVDFTTFFRRLATGTAAELFEDGPAFEAWQRRRRAALAGDPDEVAAAMNRVNPLYIPRNHLVEQALESATAGDLGPLTRLLKVLSRPFEERPGLEEYAQPGDSGPYVTFCGT